ncbi:MAG: P-loop ATPase, Sll1717 family [Actinomycetota bacterium]
MGSKRARLRSGFSLGGEAAEADRLLVDAFYESSDFRVIESRTDHRCFIVGRTGAGKSAALKRLEEINPAHVIRINPENLSLPYITNLQAIRYLDSLEVNLDTFWQTLWRHVLLVEILRHRYEVNSPDAKNNVLRALKEKFRNDRTKQAALSYLEEYEGRFWCEADERVREITDKFTEKIDAEAGANIGAPGIGANGRLKTGYESTTESRAEQVDRFQRIVNENQLARLNKMIDVLDDDILASPHDYRYVLIDDLDREWVDGRIANDLIRCLFATVYSLQHVQHLKVLVALRTNIFQELDFGRRGGGQEEKLRALVLDLRWTRPDLEDLLDERVRVAAKEVDLEARTISDLLPRANSTRGKPLDYIFDRTLLRPRDALAFANECLNVGVGKGRLAWNDIKTAERNYSAGRILALRDEWKGTYPGIDRVVEVFRRSPFRITRDDFQRRLDEVMLLLSDPLFPGVHWLTAATNSMWTSGPESTWAEIYQPLIRILYNIGLVGIGAGNSGAPVFLLDDPRFVEQQSNLDGSEYFYIHRTYHEGLDMRPSRDGRSVG